MALHAHSRYWGEDALVWRPSRWIEHSSKSASEDIGTRLSRERLLVPPKGAYFAWSEGARGCPGKKFAQVEFVATMAALFRTHRVQPVPKKGETLDQARNRVLDVVKDTVMQLLLQMRDPNSVAVTWSRR
jgi:cytochrome P450